ncbi:hypothetical protein [Maritalea porphyrae]|uniref:hypothetical protein n=1 Tax=Maritalea porphyrae TaxID=880732 RepID=UPI0022AF6149|nr:hypothetical protein [Maritalea porphyrae]MCZ4270726.1 hypothetical protein [Maritalea porphyrae]
MSDKIPYDVLFAPGADPKVTYETLYPKYMEVRLSRSPEKIKFRDRELWFRPDNLEEWAKVMAELKAAAGIQSNLFAITAG